MFKGHWKRWLIIGSVVLALTVGTVGIVSAHGGPDGGWFGRRDNHDELLADELDITVEELAAARDATRAKALDQALENGDITEEQYEAMQTMAALRPYLNPQALMAEALGVDEDELADKPIHEWIEELELDRATLIDRLEDTHEAALDQAIADGTITEDEADDLEDRFFGMRLRGWLRTRPGGFGGRGRFGGRGGMRGGFGDMLGHPENGPFGE